MSKERSGKIQAFWDMVEPYMKPSTPSAEPTAKEVAVLVDTALGQGNTERNVSPDNILKAAKDLGVDLGGVDTVDTELQQEGVTISLDAKTAIQKFQAAGQKVIEQVKPGITTAKMFEGMAEGKGWGLSKENPEAQKALVAVASQDVDVCKAAMPYMTPDSVHDMCITAQMQGNKEVLALGAPTPALKDAVKKTINALKITHVTDLSTGETVDAHKYLTDGKGFATVQNGELVPQSTELATQSSDGQKTLSELAIAHPNISTAIAPSLNETGMVMCLTSGNEEVVQNMMPIAEVDELIMAGNRSSGDNLQVLNNAYSDVQMRPVADYIKMAQGGASPAQLELAYNHSNMSPSQFAYAAGQIAQGNNTQDLDIPEIAFPGFIRGGTVVGNYSNTQTSDLENTPGGVMLAGAAVLNKLTGGLPTTLVAGMLKLGADAVQMTSNGISTLSELTPAQKVGGVIAAEMGAAAVASAAVISGVKKQEKEKEKQAKLSEEKKLDVDTFKKRIHFLKLTQNYRSDRTSEMLNEFIDQVKNDPNKGQAYLDEMVQTLDKEERGVYSTHQLKGMDNTKNIEARREAEKAAEKFERNLELFDNLVSREKEEDHAKPLDSKSLSVKEKLGNIRGLLVLSLKEVGKNVSPKAAINLNKAIISLSEKSLELMEKNPKEMENILHAADFSKEDAKLELETRKNRHLEIIKMAEGNIEAHQEEKRAHRDMLEGIPAAAAKRERGLEVAIMNFAGEGNLEEVTRLAKDHPQLLSYSNDDGTTPLHVAAREGQQAVVDALVQAGIDINVKNKHGETPLHVAAEHGKENVVEGLLASKAKVDARDINGHTPFHHAASSGQKRISDALIAAGADINARDKQGRTMLHNSVAEDNPELIKDLLEQGANVHIIDHNNMTPEQLATTEEFSLTEDISYAGEKDHLVAALKDYREAGDALVAAATKGDEGAVKKMLKEAPYLVNYKNFNDDTPLHGAASKGHKEVAELLVAKGANLAIANDQGKTAMDVAYGKANGWLKEQLGYRDGGREVGDTLADMTPHKLDQIQGKVAERQEAIHRLERLGKRVMAKRDNARAGRALMDAAANGEVDKVNEILEKRPNLVYGQNVEGNTALHVAAENGHTEMLKLLVEKGARLNATNAMGHTALEAAEHAHENSYAKYWNDYGGVDTPTPAIEFLEGEQQKLDALVKGLTPQKDAPLRIKDATPEQLAEMKAHDDFISGAQREEAKYQQDQKDRYERYLADREATKTRAQQEALKQVAAAIKIQKTFRGVKPKKQLANAKEAAAIKAEEKHTKEKLVRLASSPTGYIADVAAVLIKHPELINAPLNENGETVLHIAAEHRHPELSKALVAMGANVLQTNNYGQDAYDLAQETAGKAWFTRDTQAEAVMDFLRPEITKEKQRLAAEALALEKDKRDKEIKEKAGAKVGKAIKKGVGIRKEIKAKEAAKAKEDAKIKNRVKRGLSEVIGKVSSTFANQAKAKQEVDDILKGGKEEKQQQQPASSEIKKLEQLATFKIAASAFAATENRKNLQDMLDSYQRKVQKELATDPAKSLKEITDKMIKEDFEAKGGIKSDPVAMLGRALRGRETDRDVFLKAVEKFADNPEKGFQKSESKSHSAYKPQGKVR